MHQLVSRYWGLIEHVCFSDGMEGEKRAERKGSGEGERERDRGGKSKLRKEGSKTEERIGKWRSERREQGEIKKDR